MKLFFFDTETTGVDNEKNGIHQISGIIRIDDKIVDSFNFKCVPFDDCIYSDEALQVCNKTIEEIKANPLTEKQCVSEIIKLLDKHCFKFNKKDKLFMVGYNVHFDNQFLRALFLRAEENFFGLYFWSNPIDVMTLAGQRLLEHRPFMKNFKLMTVAETLDLLKGKEGNFHDAMFDVEITMDIYDFLLTEKCLVPENPKSENLQEKALEVFDLLDCTKEPKKINTEPIKKLNKIDESRLDSKIWFGKYNGYNFETLIKTDSQYLIWLHDNIIQGIKFSDDLIIKIREQAIVQSDEQKKKLEQKSSRSSYGGSDGGYHNSAASQESLDSFGASDSFDDYPF